VTDDWATRLVNWATLVTVLHFSSVFEMYFNIFKLKVMCAFCFELLLYLKQITTVKILRSLCTTVKYKHHGCTGDCNYETAVVTSQMRLLLTGKVVRRRRARPQNVEAKLDTLWKLFD